jgi:sugar (pentulose or hexulose) kinase
MNVAVLDIGKSNVKLSAVTEDGVVLETLSTPNISIDEPPYRHSDLDGVEGWVLDGLRQLTSRHKLTTAVVSGHGSAGVLVDDERAVMPMIDYEQIPPTSVVEAYRKEAGPYAERGSPIMHGATHQARQMLWLESEFPRQFARAKWYLGLPQYWAFRLTGVAVSEVTVLAAQSHLWDTPGRRFSRIVERRGWQRLMPPMVPAHRRIGALKPDLVARHGLPPDLGVLAGIHDSSANHYRYRAAGLGQATVMSTGTWIVGLTTRFDSRTLREDLGMTCNADIDGNPVAGALTMAGREFVHLAGEGIDATVHTDMITNLIGRGTYAIPSFGNDDGLFPGSAGKGRVLGQEPANPKEWRALALLYTALLADACLDAIEAHGQLVLDGSFVRDPLFSALVAALRPGCEVFYNLDADGIAAGSALLARHETRKGTPPITLEKPNPLKIDDLHKYRSRWRELASHSSRPGALS